MKLGFQFSEKFNCKFLILFINLLQNIFSIHNCRKFQNSHSFLIFGCKSSLFAIISTHFCFPSLPQKRNKVPASASARKLLHAIWSAVYPLLKQNNGDCKHFCCCKVFANLPFILQFQELFTSQ